MMTLTQDKHNIIQHHNGLFMGTKKKAYTAPSLNHTQGGAKFHVIMSSNAGGRSRDIVVQVVEGGGGGIGHHQSIKALGSTSTKTITLYER